MLIQEKVFDADRQRVTVQQGRYDLALSTRLVGGGGRGWVGRVLSALVKDCGCIRCEYRWFQRKGRKQSIWKGIEICYPECKEVQNRRVGKKDTNDEVDKPLREENECMGMGCG